MTNVIQGMIVQYLQQAWQSLPPISIPSTDDYTVALEVFSKMANQAAYIALPPFTRQYGDHAAKVKDYVIQNSARFRRECESGFPFAKVEKEDSEKGLQQVFEKNHSLLAVHFLQREKWLDEETLNNTFGKNINPITFRSIPYTCCLLMDAYKNGDLKAGYYLLWLIKFCSQATFPLPAKETFSNKTVQEVVSGYIENKGALGRPDQFFGILFSGTSQPLFQDLIINRQPFIEILKNTFSSTPLAVWPAKIPIITLALIHFSEEKRNISDALRTSPDALTQTIGNQIAGLLGPANPIPHLYALKDLLQISLKKAEKMFNLRIDIFSDKAAPPFTKRLIVNSALVHGDLLIGVCRDETKSQLMAYDMKTEQTLWSVNVTSSHLPKIHQMMGNIELYAAGDDTISRYKMETGELLSQIKLPQQGNDLFLVQEGMIVQKVETTLHVSQYREGKWQTPYTASFPGGVHKPHPNHLLFHNQNILYMISPQGHQNKLRNCLDARAFGHKLCLVEQSNQQNCLTVRHLMDQALILSEPEKIIPLGDGPAAIAGFCPAHAVVISKDSLLLINLENSKVTTCKYKLPANAAVLPNPHAKEVYCFDPATKELWKITPLGSQSMGTFDTPIEMIHVDAKGNLFFI